ncbi:hypothetical protein BELL_0910g00030 [Botrytis elliptica]|uniref:FAD/NAD(P)-binding domain-containing protein n=1 Tax=Botrytis elliptica TaxID=278938 RepID=A0A4Z1J6D9_9HELO|nr:hypothetical protein EAE99_010625 [Botrytis elliptica]TGO67132.1 hypothetical protein BELL_0910g00030 [Botrytis elliptica]
MPPKSLVDVLIIGAGPAGISCAAALARLRHTAIVFSSNKFRNEKSKHMHTVSTWDHRDPSEFRAASREDILARYKTICFEDVGIQTIEKVSKDGEGEGEGSGIFKAIDDTGKDWWGRKLVLATGVKDIMVDIEGYEECWAKSIFHCLYCHGYESSPAKSAGVIAIGDCASPHIALHLARQALRLSENVTIYTHGNDALAEEIEAAKVASNTDVNSKCRSKIEICNYLIQKFIPSDHPSSGLTVSFDENDGAGLGDHTHAFLLHKPVTEQTNDLAHQLGIELTEQGDLKVTAPFNETSVRGVFATGDCASMLKNVVGAMYSGTCAGAGVGSQIQGED